VNEKRREKREEGLVQLLTFITYCLLLSHTKALQSDQRIAQRKGLALARS
jgi:hypothetical protein